MYREALQGRIRANLRLPVAESQAYGFVLEIVLAAALGWLVQRLLSWWWPPSKRKLDAAIRRGCREAAATPEAKAARLDADTLYRLYGGKVRLATFEAEEMATPADIAALRAEMQTQEILEGR